MNYCKITSILLFYFLCFFQTLLFGQENSDEYNFSSIEDGFSQRAITSVMKDTDGYLWISTYGDGIFRYNGIDFKNYKQEMSSKEKSLNSSIVFYGLQDAQKNIWFGTQIGLNFYNHNIDKFESIPLQEKDKKLKFAIHAIAEYNDNTLLLGTHEFGLFKFDKKTLTQKIIPYKANEPVQNLLINAIIKSSNGRFLIGTNHGLMTFDPYNEVLQLAKFNTENGYETINKSIESLHIAKDNSIWIGTFSSGLVRIQHNNNDVYSIEEFFISKKRILSLAEKTNGNILCGTENDGLFEINYVTKNAKNYQQNKLKQNGIKSNSIWTVFTDPKDRIFLGYYNKGIDLHDDNYNKFSSIKSIPYLSNSLNSSSVTGIIKDNKGRFWISMFDGGVNVYDPKKKKFINLYDQKNPIAKGLNRLDIPTIFIDSKQNIWIGTWDSGLFFLKYKSKEFININKSSNNSVFRSNRVMSFDEDSKGTIWIGTFGNGLYSFDLSSENFSHHNSLEFQKYHTNSSSIRKVIVDHQDAVWIGTRNGLYKIVKDKTGSFRVYSINDLMNKNLKSEIDQSKNSSIVFSLFEDLKNNMWIGTLGNGLAKYSVKSNSIEWYNLDNGLIHETISSITQSNDGSLWIGGNKGLSKLDTEKNTFVNFNKKDGLLSNSFNYNAVFKDIDNIIYFGNVKGINYFNPNNINYNQEKPVVYLSDLKISNEVITPEIKNSTLKNVISKTKKLSLNHKQSNFTIDYFAINYTRGENNQYAYYLKDFDEKWNYVGAARSASYKNIPPGDYTFMVKASNNDGVWNNIPTTIDIKILPAWWATNSAIVSYILTILLIAYIVFKYISTRIKEKRVLNTERKEYKQFEALNAKKIQFFTNISHEFRTPLTLILTPLEDIIEDNKIEFPKNIKEKHQIIYKNAKRLSRLINELMDFRKLQFNKMSINASQINIVPFIEEVVSHFQEEASLKNIMLSVEYDQDDFIIWSDPSMLEKIIFNLLSNAFKATPAEGLITIQINNPSNLIHLPLVNKNTPVKAIEIIIKDTGLGIKKENIKKVFDRFYQANEINEQYYGGTGIGLELVKNFVDLHKGKIVLKSKENIGTQFKIYFPLGYSHLKENDINKNHKKTINQYSDSKKEQLINYEFNNEENEVKKIILIVEDNIELRSYIKNELKDEYHIKEAENGLEGLEKATKYIPDIIITDVMMPIMDGFEFCDHIKNDLKTSHIPILMVTAKGMQIDKVKGIDSGADVYLNKPFNMKVLRSHINQLITSRKILFDKYFNPLSTTVDYNNTTSLDKEFMRNVLSHINENINDEKLNVEHLAGELFLSRSKLYRKIKALTGDTANEFIRKIRLEKAKQLISGSEYTISEVCYKVGFSSPSYFTKCFKNHFGILPTEFREPALPQNSKTEKE
tara:strand:- start:13827 stop:18026 length:4200 start_codon:yes stop_codon:yes gene_type:complete